MYIPLCFVRLRNVLHVRFTERHLVLGYRSNGTRTVRRIRVLIIQNFVSVVLLNYTELPTHGKGSSIIRAQSNIVELFKLHTVYICVVSAHIAHG